MMRWIVLACLVIGCGADDAQDSESATGEGEGEGELDGDETVVDVTSISTSLSSFSESSAGDEADATSVGEDTGTDDPVTCVVDGMRPDEPDPDHQGTAMGTNGSFTDECDADGNLLEYVCETMQVCVDPPNPICTYPQTGNVVPQMFDCDGTCVDGTCNSRCADFGDMLVWVEVGPDTAVFDSAADDRRLSCMLLFDAANDTFDCNTSPQPGDATTITSLGLHGAWCTGGAWGNIGIGDPEQCAYACTYLYD